MKNVLSSGDHTGNTEWLEVVRQHVDSLRFGVVQVTVHDGKVVQIERTERVRLDKSSASNH
jgi:hypothetical protein